jgi:prophage endopeptidase
MLSLFNPWVILGILMALSSAFGGGYYKGYQKAEADQQLEIARLNAEARKVEVEAIGKVNAVSAQLVRANNEAKKEIQKRDADIASGTLRLSIPTQSPVCASSDATSTSRPDSSRSELDPAFAQAIVRVTDDGDESIRKLNACIAVYNQVREMINQPQRK